MNFFALFIQVSNHFYNVLLLNKEKKQQMFLMILK